MSQIEFNNYEKNYADVKEWLNSEEYLDFIIPQIYYGFNNEAKSYTTALNEWQSINKNKDMLIALALYKVGQEDMFARGGNREWIDNNNILMSKKRIQALLLDLYHS